MFLLGPYVLTGVCRAKACFSSSLPLTLSCPEPHARDKGLGVVVVSLTMSSSCKDHCNPYLWQLFHMWLLLLLCYPSGTKAFCSEVRNQISGFLFFFFCCHINVNEIDVLIAYVGIGKEEDHDLKKKSYILTEFYIQILNLALMWENREGGSINQNSI